jgi:hypothetical protein
LTHLASDTDSTGFAPQSLWPWIAVRTALTTQSLRANEAYVSALPAFPALSLLPWDTLDARKALRTGLALSTNRSRRASLAARSVDSWNTVGTGFAAWPAISWIAPFALITSDALYPLFANWPALARLALDHHSGTTLLAAWPGRSGFAP